MKRTKRNHVVTFKVQIALAAITGDKTLAELAEPFSVHPIQITDWKQQLLVQAADVFGPAKPMADTSGSRVISNSPGTTYGRAEVVQQTGATSLTVYNDGVLKSSLMIVALRLADYLLSA